MKLKLVANLIELFFPPDMRAMLYLVVDRFYYTMRSYTHWIAILWLDYAI